MKTVRNNTKLKDCDGNSICTNYPLATDGDSIYVKDLNLDSSDIGSFTGEIETLFSDIQNEITDTTTTNPKNFTLVFQRPVETTSVGIASKTGDFSNVKIKLNTVSGDTRYTFDDSGNNTKYTSNLYQFPSQKFDTMVVEFHTTDEIKIVGMSIPKLFSSNTYLYAFKPDGTVTQINATTGGNLKSSIEEFDESLTIPLDGLNDNLDGENALVVGAAIYGRVSESLLVPLKVDGSTQDLQVAEHEHAEIHGGDHYLICSHTTLSLNAVFDIQITTPNTTKWGHFVFRLEPENETLWELYEDVTINTAGTAYVPINNNRNSANTSAITFGLISNSNTTNANADTSITSALLLESGIIGSGKRNSGSSERSSEIVLKQNSIYTFRFTANSAGYVNYCLGWYEHTDKN